MLLVRWMKYTIYTVYVRWTFISRSRNHSNEKWIDMENLLYFQCVLKGCCFLLYRSLCELYVHLQLVILVWADRGKELFHSFSKFNYCVPFCWEFSLYGRFCFWKCFMMNFNGRDIDNLFQIISENYPWNLTNSCLHSTLHCWQILPRHKIQPSITPYFHWNRRNATRIVWTPRRNTATTFLTIPKLAECSNIHMQVYLAVARLFSPWIAICYGSVLLDFFAWRRAIRAVSKFAETLCTKTHSQNSVTYTGTTCVKIEFFHIRPRLGLSLSYSGR